MASLPADSIDCIWTDPPYLLSNDGITCVGGRMVKVNKGEWDRSRGVDLDHEFNRTWLAACHRVLKPAGALWVSGTLHVYLSVGMAMQQLGFRILNDIVWEKPAPPPNLGCRCFTHSTEMLLWATKARKGGKDRHKFNYEAMKEENAGKQMKSVWRLSTPGEEEKTFGKHPTQKPIALIARCLRATTDPGDVGVRPVRGIRLDGRRRADAGPSVHRLRTGRDLCRVSRAPPEQRGAACVQSGTDGRCAWGLPLRQWPLTVQPQASGSRRSTTSSSNTAR